MKEDKNLNQATLGAGCFWCVEAIFKELKGVISVEAGYAGGEVREPGYEEVCSGTTGHAEVARITFDPGIITYDELLEVFFHVHDPTTRNRQGADIGKQYRSVIFFHDEIQKKTAQEIFQQINGSGLWEDPLVTAIEPLNNYYTAENYHQDFFAQNSDNPYCESVIAPKLRNFHNAFKDKLKNTRNNASCS